MIKNGIESCDGCNSIVYRYAVARVTKSGKIYCSKCEIPKNEEVVFKGLLKEVFCSKCKEMVLEAQKRIPDINGRVFCSDEHKRSFYKKVETCKCCGIEIC